MDTHETHETQETEKPTAPNNLLVPGAIIVAGVLIALAVLYSGGFRSPSNAGGGKPADGGTAGAGQKTNAEIASDGPALGSPDAPVVVVEFSDFQCPFCGKFHQEVEQKLLNDYVKTGKVQFVYRNFAFLGPESVDAAAAALCANDQGKFWLYHDYLFSHQQGENQGAFAKDKLKSFAAAIGLNTSQFNSCFDSQKYTEKVNKDKADAVALGVNATPTTFVNGVQIQGAVPYAQFKQAVDQALTAKAGK
ncbi:MAG: hypothetical protein A3C11_00945 [Candidatus Sungbacteria bacterium RIFCSPHIGHO2_02_FULL_49_12]|uniref:Thioredoxin domain-containing protein n=1 Tax=Candidatus Sungbacteria bacterium RIFCSPHIGHO2_02_FULL_49_12 TaxID=1802271 RepID=A0A1G2KNN3_9BACT|nr:MAG: hypothetical protein A3C11_00945 [Candidatus Sungbacteria bacterium RIFCSPHIGHO2_02_FULL_49_12]